MNFFAFAADVRKAENRTLNLLLALTILLLMASYAAAFHFLIRTYGPAIRLFTGVFILPAALLWGIRGGAVIGAVTVVLNFALHRIHGIPFEGGFIGPATMCVAVAMVGALSDLGRKLRTKIRELNTVQEALRISETKYRKLFEMESDAVFLFKTDTGEILEANKAAETLFEYTREELLRMKHKQLSLKSEKAGVIFRHEAKNKSTIYARKKTGVTFPVEVSARHFDYQGHRVVISTLRDITYRKWAEEEKRSLEKKLQQAQRLEAIGTLAGGIAHDFNNILGAITGYGELLKIKNPPLDDRRQNYLRRILNAADRARELVVQILTFSRQSESQKHAVKIKPIAKEVISLLRASIPTTIEIRHRFEAENDTIIADPTQIYQIIMNLCTNAAQAMVEKKGLIDVSVTDVTLDEAFAVTHPEVEPGPYLEITVTDTGHGMDRVVLERIFEPYFSTKEKSKGTGLGLSVVHGIVMHHGGCIVVESEPGNGTTFRVFFPLTIPGKEPMTKQTANMPTGTERILVVDDEPPLTEMTGEILRELGYHVEQRVSSQEALELFKAKPHAFDLVITDMSMPYLSGTDLAKEITHINPHVPIIICTGYSDLIDEMKAKRLGFNRLLMKPLSFHDLATSVREALDNSRQRTDA